MLHGPLHRSETMCDPLLAWPQKGGSCLDPLRHVRYDGLIRPARDPPAAFMLRAFCRDWTDSTRARRLIAGVTAFLRCVQPNRQAGAVWTGLCGVAGISAKIIVGNQAFARATGCRWLWHIRDKLGALTPVDLRAGRVPPSGWGRACRDPTDFLGTNRPRGAVIAGAWGIRHSSGHHQFVFGSGHHVHVSAARHALTNPQRAAIVVGQRDVTRTPGGQFGTQGLVRLLTHPQWLDACLPFQRRPPGRSGVVSSMGLQRLEVAGDLVGQLRARPRQRLSIPIALAVGRGRACAAINRDQCTANQRQVLTAYRAGAADLLPRLESILANGRHRFAIGGQLFEQADQLHIAVAFAVEEPAGAPAVAVAVARALEPIARMVGRTTGWRSNGTANATRLEIALINTGVDEANRMGIGDSRIARRWDEEDRVTLDPLDRGHGRHNLGKQNETVP